MNIVLVGFMGSGKSSTAWYISQNFGYRYVDTDRLIEKETGMSIKDIFALKGEQYFRRLEKTIMLTHIRYCEDCVIATGGGMPCHSGHMEQLKRIGWVFHLELDFDEIIRRISNFDHRPLFNDIDKARQLYQSRKACYEKAHFTIDASGDIEHIAKRILSQINT